MTNQNHKACTIAVGCWIIISTLTQTEIYTAAYYENAFKTFSDMGLSFMVYAVGAAGAAPLLFVVGAIGLISYHYWGFYLTYAAYLIGLSAAYLPLIPEPIFNIIPQSLQRALAIVIIISILVFTIYLHRLAKKHGYIVKRK